MSRSVVHPESPQRLLYITSEDGFFASHFAHLARAARAAGYEVGIASGFSPSSALEHQGFKLYPQKFERGRRSLAHVLRALPRLISTLRKTRPDIVHIIGLQFILFVAPVAALFTRAQVVLAPIGLGQFWVEDGWKAKSLRAAVRLYLRFFQGLRFFYLFENGEDVAELNLEHYPRLKIVGGAGVDETGFTPSPQPAVPPLRVAVVARMIRSKGIVEAAQAVRAARKMGHDITLDLWGAPDAANASSFTEDELRALSHDGVKWHGATRDIKGVWENTHAALLLSRREGLPKALLEAASCGRPIIASNVPGCRALVRDQQEGLLVGLHDTDGAARALIRLAEDAGLRERLGANARTRVVSGFTQTQVANDILGFYGAALSNVTPPRAQPL